MPRPQGDGTMRTKLPPSIRGADEAPKEVNVTTDPAQAFAEIDMEEEQRDFAELSGAVDVAMAKEAGHAAPAGAPPQDRMGHPGPPTMGPPLAAGQAIPDDANAVMTAFVNMLRGAVEGAPRPDGPATPEPPDEQLAEPVIFLYPTVLKPTIILDQGQSGVPDPYHPGRLVGSREPVIAQFGPIFDLVQKRRIGMFKTTSKRMADRVRTTQAYQRGLIIEKRQRDVNERNRILAELVKAQERLGATAELDDLGDLANMPALRNILRPNIGPKGDNPEMTGTVTSTK